MKLAFEKSLLYNIRGSLVTSVICVLLIVIGNYQVYTDLAKEPVEHLFQTGIMVFANQEAFLYAVIPLVVLVGTVINMFDRINVYRAYHQAQKANKPDLPGKD
ncbi:hypothetical protein ACFODZ_10570 [Marinicella sediminis]|uniref:Uncharacterized protein n=1 Tax=Marinicella sediminis TaxID=1792834 RepID=A0ABV7JDA0_9GAMM|nr:hypothetical protein [Marinicella sediminis]